MSALRNFFEKRLALDFYYAIIDWLTDGAGTDGGLGGSQGRVLDNPSQAGYCNACEKRRLPI